MFGSSHLRRLSLVRRKGKGNTNPAAQAMAQLLEQTLDAESLL
ncbi:MAG: hypothetical protein OXU20_11330 [Myxococcales bacterium]|nr:hypothetical protein [Myxococcales bacterium]